MSVKRIAREEDGTTAVLLVMVLVVLMGFAAIAIDGAAAWALRRQDQSGADTGAIAGALFTAGRTKAQAMQDAEDEIIRITYSTMTPDLTADEWAAAWVTCTDASKPAEFTETLGSACISFTDNLSKVRVQTPVIPWVTTFASVIGFDTIDTSASAEVDTVLATNGGVLPFGMPGVAQNDTEICLKTGANPKNTAPCDGPDTGNFGFLDFTQFGNDALGTAKICQGGGGDRLERNIAQGIDHPLGVWATPLPADSHNDTDACNSGGNINARPYQVKTNTGNVAQALDDGFADGTDGLDGKLARGSNLIDVRGQLLDDTPLWDYLNANGLLVCGVISNHDDLVTCLEDPSHYNIVGLGREWKDGEIFTASIIDAPRFGWVPLFHEPTLGDGSTTLTIETFRPIYIQTTFWGCNATGCDLEWDPGEPFSPGAHNIRIEASTAFSIPRAALPAEVQAVAPGTDGQVSYLLSQ